MGEQRIGEVSQEIQRVRAQMEENEQLATLMRGLRGQNLRDAQFADDNIKLRLVEVSLVTCPARLVSGVFNSVISRKPFVLSRKLTPLALDFIYHFSFHMFVTHLML